MILENVQFCETITAKEEHIIFFFLQKLLVLPSAEVLRKGVSSPDFGSDRSLFCLDGPSTYLRFWRSYKQSCLRPKELWHWIPFEILRVHLVPSLLIFLFWPSYSRKVLSFIRRKNFLNHILYLLLLYKLNTPPSIGSISFNSSPEQGLICLGSVWGLKVMLRASILWLLKRSDRKSSWRLSLQQRLSNNETNKVVIFQIS